MVVISALHRATSVQIFLKPRLQRMTLILPQLERLVCLVPMPATVLNARLEVPTTEARSLAVGTVNLGVAIHALQIGAEPAIAAMDRTTKARDLSIAKVATPQHARAHAGIRLARLEIVPMVD